MQENPYPGFFIAVEGIDGSGKTTQAKNIVSWYASKGYSAVYTKEPSYLDDQQRLRQAITGALEISSLALQELFIEDRQAHLEREIIPQIGKKAPTAVISDRYFLSTMAYGMATDISFEELWQLHRKIRWFVFPDLTIIIDVAADIAFERTKEKKSEADIFEKKDTMGKIRAQYTALAKMLRNDNVYMIDGSNSPEAIFAQIEPLLDKLVKAKYH